MAETVIPVVGNVSGDITACKIETAQKSVDRNGAFRLTQKETYVTYDVCTKQTISEYQTSTITGFGFLGIVGIVIVLIVAFMMWLDGI